MDSVKLSDYLEDILPKGATTQQVNQAIVQSVKACMDECDSYFLFDMIHLKLANQWQYTKERIGIAMGKK